MFLLLKKKLSSFDWVLFVLIFLLLSIGLTVQYSLAHSLEPELFTVFRRQVIFVFFGLFVFFVTSFLDFRIFKSLTSGLYFFAVTSLALLFVFSPILEGVRRWYVFGFFYFQPIELAKIILVIVFAKIWGERVKEVSEIKRLIWTIFLLVPPVFLTLLQPDLGGALVFIPVWFFLTAINIRRWKHFFLIILFFIIAAVIFWSFGLRDYQRSRIVEFISPGADPLGRGYQITQSKIAIGAGRFWGRGIGQGSQGQMRFLPASRNDFVFAVLSEELGFVGSGFIIVLFALIFWRMVKISKKIYDYFGFFLVLGVAFNFFIQVIINIGMNLGLLPIVGISLPLISYGGSAMVATLFSLGLVQSVIIHQRSMLSVA